MTTPHVTIFIVQGGDVVPPGAGWVYLWRETDARERSIIYVGATALDPAVRARMHLHDPDPAVGRIRARYPAAGGDLARPLAVHAVAVPPGGRRPLIKARVAWLASESGLLSPRWCGDAPTPLAETLWPAEEECAHALVAALR
jgi:hypothetical protein